MKLNCNIYEVPFFYKRKRVSAFIIDQTVIQIGRQYNWLSFCIESSHSSLFGIHIPKEKISLS